MGSQPNIGWLFFFASAGGNLNPTTGRQNPSRR